MEAGKWRKGGIAMADISIIGAGSWGIALALLLHKNGHHITVWSIIQEEIDMLSKEHEHKEKLPGVKLPEDMEFTTDLEAAVKGKDILVLAVPSPFTRSTSHSMKEYVGEGQVIVNVAKGIEEKSLLTLSQIIEEEIPQAKVAVLSGPSHAEEVGRGIPTTIVVGAKEKTTAEWLQNIFMNEAFRVYISPDVLGIELGAALKNVVALAAGIADGLGYGDNTKAALITRGITEIARLGTAMGGRFETFCGLTGIGDLIVTCASMHSRNRRAGILIGKGYSMEEAMKEVKMVVEGVYSAKAAMALAKKYDVQIPIIEQVNAVLFDGQEAGAAVKELMIRDKKVVVGAAAFSRKTGSIDYLGVHPQYRKHDIAKAFLDFILCNLFTGRKISITTFREGDKADTGQRAAYKQLGFAEAELLTEFGYPTQRLILYPKQEEHSHE